MNRDEQLSVVLEKAGFASFEAAEDDALKIVNKYIIKYGDGATSALAFSAYKAMRKEPESRDTILLRLAQIILSEAR